MKTIDKLYRYISMSLLVVILASCEKDFLDINTDPNNPTDAQLNQLLPSAQVNMAFIFGNSPGGLNGYAGTIMHHYVRRGNLNDYGLQGGDFAITTAWNSIYAGALTDLTNIIDAGTENGDFHYVGIAQIMKAYIYATLVDVWGEVPYFEANQGSSNPFPPFDGGAAIYADLFLTINDGIANLAKSSNFSPGADDLYYGGNLTKWRKLAKTLKLRMYNNIRLVQNVNTDVTALLNEGDLISAADEFELVYGSSISPENRNPGYVQEWSPGGSFYYMDPYFFEILRSQDTFGHGGVQFGVEDPRLPYYFFNQLPAGASDSDAENPCAYCPSDAGTSFLSIYSYSFNIDPNEGFDQGRSQTVAGLYPLGGRYDDGNGGIAANGASLTAGQVSGNPGIPQRLLSYHERLFIEAELAQVGTTGGNARSLLSDAIDAAFAKVNELAGMASAPTISSTDITTYRDAVLASYDASSAAGQLEIIMTQKWIAVFGNSLVAYNDYRRTGYPELHNGNTDNLNVTVQTRQFPVSFPYDIGNLQLNPNAPSQRVIATQKVFWDNN
ncbi:SusD/RagB family nutrient-binding outer membrane lipoprotein [Fulvivirga imtechensis]|nr:SusD/RagB family nutrient-binding outer membrane lipoprotein [Fulvivirga imtechensis]